MNDKRLKRILGLDIVKGICIILMVIGHSAPPSFTRYHLHVSHALLFHYIWIPIKAISYTRDTIICQKKVKASVVSVFHMDCYLHFTT